MKKMTNTARVILALASLAMLGSYFFPLWRIELWAPQYPEGLALSIWHNKLGGDVDIINGLNHYIGMAHLKQESFPEFGILPYLIISFVVLGLLVAALGQKRWLNAYLGLMLTAGVVALADFYRWGYAYGHNLDPNAAIKIPGMSYQPPVIGYKELLNFGAFSIPDTGGWIFISAGLVVAALTAYEAYFFPKGFLWKKKKELKTAALSIVSAMVLLVSMSSCNAKPEQINYGRDACANCKMTIVDNRFGCELVTDKGKAMMFDDLHCMVSFIKMKELNEKSFKFLVVNDYLNGATFLNIKDAYFMKSDLFKSPMRGDVAAFSVGTPSGKSKKEVEKSKPSNARALTWADMKNEF